MSAFNKVEKDLIKLGPLDILKILHIYILMVSRVRI